MSAPYRLGETSDQRVSIRLKGWVTLLDALVGGGLVTLLVAGCAWAVYAAVRKFGVSGSLEIIVLFGFCGSASLAWLLFGRQSTNTYSEIAWDQETSSLSLVASGFQLLGKRQRLAFQDISRLEFGIDSTAAMSISFGDDGDSPLPQSLQIDGVESEQDRIRLITHIGRIMGLDRGRILRHDHLALEVALLPREDGTAKEFLLPKPGQETASLPEIPLFFEPFAPAEFPGLGRVLDWRPGEQVRLLEDGSTRLGAKARHDFFQGAFIGAAGMMILIPFWSRTGLPPAIPILGLPLLGGICAALWPALSSPRREILMDWTSRTITVDSDGQRAEIPFSSIKRLVLQGRSRNRLRGGRAGSATRYSCAVLMELEDSLELLAETDELQDRSSAYQPCASMAEELKKAMGLSWDWDGWGH